MEYQTNFGECKLKIFSDKAPLQDNVVCKGMVIVENHGKDKGLIVRADLSDVSAQKAEEIQAFFDNLDNETLSSSVCEVDTVFKLYLNKVNLFTNESDTAVHLFTAGARSDRMAVLEKMICDEDRYYQNHPYSKEADKLVSDIVTLLQGGQDEGWISFANNNTYITENSKQVFYGWAERLFVETICGKKHEVIVNA